MKMRTIATRAFSRGGDIPAENTQCRGNVFPGLARLRMTR